MGGSRGAAKKGDNEARVQSSGAGPRGYQDAWHRHAAKQPSPISPRVRPPLKLASLPVMPCSSGESHTDCRRCTPSPDPGPDT